MTERVFHPCLKVTVLMMLIKTLNTYVVETSFYNLRPYESSSTNRLFSLTFFLDTFKSSRKTILKHFLKTTVSEPMFPRGQMLVQSQISKK